MRGKATRMAVYGMADSGQRSSLLGHAGNGPTAVTAAAGLGDNGRAVRHSVPAWAVRLAWRAAGTA